MKARIVFLIIFLILFTIAVGVSIGVSKADITIEITDDSGETYFVKKFNDSMNDSKNINMLNSMPVILKFTYRYTLKIVEISFEILAVVGIILIMRDDLRGELSWYIIKQTVFYAFVFMLNGHMATTNLVSNRNDHLPKLYVFMGTQLQHFLMSTISLNRRLLESIFFK